MVLCNWSYIFWGCVTVGYDLLEVKVDIFVPVQQTLTAMSSWRWVGHNLWLRVCFLVNLFITSLCRQIDVPLFAYVVEHSTGLNYSADISRRADSNFLLQNKKPPLPLAYATLHHTPCFLVHPEMYTCLILRSWLIKWLTVICIVRCCQLCLPVVFRQDLYFFGQLNQCQWVSMPLCFLITQHNVSSYRSHMQ